MHTDVTTQSQVSLDVEAFRALAREYNLIPVYREILGDLHTPVSAFHKLDDGRFAYLLESVEGGEKVGRYSFLGGAPSIVLMTRGREVTIERYGQRWKRARWPRGRSAARAEGADARVSRGESARPAEILRRRGRLFQLRYRAFLRRIARRPRPTICTLPECYFVFTDACVIFDHVRHRILLVCNALWTATPTPPTSARWRKSTI